VTIKGTILGSYGDLTGKYDTMGKCDGGSLWDAIGEYRVLMKWIYILLYIYIYPEKDVSLYWCAILAEMG
jgi:hypothetical protein